MLNKIISSALYACCKGENYILKIQFLSLKIQTFSAEEFPQPSLKVSQTTMPLVSKSMDPLHDWHGPIPVKKKFNV